MADLTAAIRTELDLLMDLARDDQGAELTTAALLAVLDRCDLIRAEGRQPHKDISARVLADAIADQFETDIAEALGIKEPDHG